jgi:uncharacterized membrane protein
VIRPARLAGGLLAAAALASALGAGLAAPAGAQEDGPDLEIEAFDVEATVNPDGSMDVTERLSIDFAEEANGGTRDIPRGDYRIVDFRVTEGGEVRDLAPGFDDPNTGEVRWFGSADHSKVIGDHTYQLDYTVLDAAEVFPDVGVLNWKFVGSGFPDLGRVRIDVTMPGDGTDLRAFAHGDLRGVVIPEGNTVHLRVIDNPAGSEVEARIVVPSSVFTVPPSGAPALEQILAEEGEFAAEANAARAEAARAYAAEVARGREPGCDEESSPALDRRCGELDALLREAGDPLAGEPLSLEDADRFLAIVAARRAIIEEVDRIQAERRARIANVAAPVVAALAGSAWFLLWLRVGKEPDRPADIGDYWREVPEESPAVVAAIDDWGVVDAKAFSSTVIDLAQRGWLTIVESPDGDGHHFIRSQQTTDELPLRDYESKVLWRLFEDGRPSISQDALIDEAKADRNGSAAWMGEFKGLVKADYDRQGFQQRQGCLPWLAHVGILLVLALTVLACIALGAWIGLAVAAVALVVVLGCSGLLRRRTERGARKHAEVGGLKAFLRDFSLVDDVPVGHLALYERYLVYAVALGVADRLIAGLRMRFPELADPDNGFAVWYVPVVHGGGGQSLTGMDKLASLGSVGAFADGLSSATASAFSPPSSSSGGGGGFSGGSSGGGGGGSAGGW